ncbi:hypothetical protein CA13_11320 [Planctomycetes bacterium CA13]|uniref:Uncharacterized protein n=1 Tax=Novipirellula herctigrandis TaxID=2527986 RepID=A0A5C5YXG4_9BACT|nr:hypothetical protein CA13_11320 [Planctomycetes bacterium CA13]
MRLLVFMTLFALPLIACAEESWMFPVTMDSPTAKVQLDSLRIAESYVEEIGGRNAITSRVIHSSVASFDEIVKWYSDRLITPDLSEKVADYDRRSAVAPELCVEHGINPKDDPTKAIVTYWFTPTLKQITTLFTNDEGGVIAILLLGTENQTRIQVMRRRTRESGG